VIERIALYQAVEITPLDGSHPEKEDPPIIAGRDALLRVFLAAGEHGGPTPLGASVELDGQVVAEAAGELAAPSQVDDLDSTLNLRIPGAALSADGAYRVTVTGSGTSQRWPPEGPGMLTVSEVNGPFQVVLVPVINHGMGPLVDPAIVAAYEQALLRLLPVSTVDVQVRDPYYFERDLCSGVAAIEMLALEILDVRARDEAPANTYYVGLIAPSATALDYLTCGGGILGMSLVGWNADDTYARGCVAAGHFVDGTSLDSEGTVVHELGHALGRRHAPCGSAGGADGKYPHAEGAIGVWGWDSGRNVLHHPQRSKDFMSYCAPAWVSDYHYVRLFNRIAHVNGSALSATATAAKSYRRLFIDDEDAARWLGPTSVTHPAGAPVTLRLVSPTGEASAGTGYRYDYSHGSGSLVLIAAEQLRGQQRLVLDGRTMTIPEVGP